MARTAGVEPESVYLVYMAHIKSNCDRSTNWAMFSFASTKGGSGFLYVFCEDLHLSHVLSWAYIDLLLDESYHQTSHIVLYYLFQ